MAWAAPHHDPRTLDLEQVDPAMRPLVSRINRSGWLWTAESCEGHGGQAGPVLGLVTDDPGRLFDCLARAHAATVRASEPEGYDPAGIPFVITLWVVPAVALGRAQVRMATRGARRDEALRVWAAMADLT